MGLGLGRVEGTCPLGATRPAGLVRAVGLLASRPVGLGRAGGLVRVGGLGRAGGLVRVGGVGVSRTGALGAADRLGAAVRRTDGLAVVCPGTWLLVGAGLGAAGVVAGGAGTVGAGVTELVRWVVIAPPPRPTRRAPRAAVGGIAHRTARGRGRLVTAPA